MERQARKASNGSIKAEETGAGFLIYMLSKRLITSIFEVFTAKSNSSF